jgi:hypothetical protein
MAKLSALGFVTNGYGQVEPNHLSAQRTGQIYAQLPAAKDYAVLENGQFVKYDYANGEVNKTGEGEWMLVFNEVKTYYDYEPACNFAMKAENYNARIYSPSGAATNGAAGLDYSGIANAGIALDGTATPMQPNLYSGPVEMTKGTMVPRVFKTNIGDIMTANTIINDCVSVTDVLGVNADGYLEKDFASDMKWQVAKVYTMPDGQKGAKIVRIA